MPRNHIELRRDEPRAAIGRFQMAAQRATFYAAGAALMGVAAEWAGLLPSTARPVIVALGVASTAGYLVTHLGGLWRWATGRPSLADDQIALALGETPAPRPARRPPMWRTRLAGAFIGAYALGAHVLRVPLERYLGDPFVGIVEVGIWGSLILGMLCAIDARDLALDGRVSRRGRIAAWLGAAAGVTYFSGAQSILPRGLAIWLLAGAFALGVAGLIAWQLERRWQQRCVPPRELPTRA